MPVTLGTSLEDVVDRLRDEGPRVFGHRDVKFTSIQTTESEASRVLKVAVAGVKGVDAVFVKVFKLRPGDRLDDVRARVVRDFDVTSRLHRSMSTVPHRGVARPLVCFPDQLAIVTEAASGETLLDVLERRAPWWPTPRVRRSLGEVLEAVGGWLRAFQDVDVRGERFSLEQMREYIDVRLCRLLATRPPFLDGQARERILRYFDRTAALVDPADLREVLTHGDFAPSNVLVTEGRITVIDFAMVTPGGRFMDVARLYTQLEFLMAKPQFRPVVIRELQRRLLAGFDPTLDADRPLFKLFLLQHLLCHISNLARNPAPPLARLYNRHQLRLRHRWLQTFAA